MMQKDEISEQKYKDLIESYCKALQDGVNERWKHMQKEIYDNEKYEVIGALMARQVTLATYIVKDPFICNSHIAPILLRTMVDAYITLSWILEDLEKRAKQYICHGLGQEKLQIEHLKTLDKTPEIEKAIQFREDWLNSQHLALLTDVNVGSWSDITIRKMADDIGESELYNFVYTPFSLNAHNMWNHIGIYNLKPCTNPLHKYHTVPDSSEIKSDFSYVMNAAKYMQKTFVRVDKKLKLKSTTILPLDFWNAYFDKGETL